MIKILLIIVACVYAPVSLGGWFGGPSNYNDCILESMKGVTSNTAAQWIVLSCRDKFPEKTPNDPEASENVVSQLTGRARVTDSGHFSGYIYNGNQDWAITQITVVLTPKASASSPQPGKGNSPAPVRLDSIGEPVPLPEKKEYNVVISVAPLTKSEFSVSVDGGYSGGYDWSITKARGHKSR